MPFVTSRNARIYWRLQGRKDATAIALLHGIGTDQTLFDEIIPFLIDDFQILRLDLRGHGASDASPGDYSLHLLGEDVLEVMDAAGIDEAALCGISLGGMVAMHLGLAAPRRFPNLVLACTSPDLKEFWQTRVATVRSAGQTAGIAMAAAAAVLSDEFAAEHPGIVDSAIRALATMEVDGYAGCGAAIRDMDIIDCLSDIQARVLVLSGSMDLATPFDGHGDRLLAAIPGARSAILPTGHWACVEDPQSFANELRDFIAARP